MLFLLQFYLKKNLQLLMKSLLKYNVVVMVKYFSRIAYYFRNSTTKFFWKRTNKNHLCDCQSDESPHEFIPMPKLKNQITSLDLVFCACTIVCKCSVIQPIKI